MKIIFLVLLSPLVSLSSSLLGVSGGIIIIPLLFYVFPTYPVSSVIGTSLAIVHINSWINLINFRRSGLSLDYQILAAIQLPIILTTILGARLVHLISPEQVKILFAIVVLGSAIKTAVDIMVSKASEKEKRESLPTRGAPAYVAASAFTGFISGLSGLGGGVILVPLMMNFLRTPSKLISPYSNAAILVSSLVGLITHSLYSLPLSGEEEIFSWAQVGSVNLLILSIFIFSGAIFSQLGVRLSQKIDIKTIKLTFISLCLFVSGRIFFELIWRK